MQNQKRRQNNRRGSARQKQVENRKRILFTIGIVVVIAAVFFPVKHFLDKRDRQAPGGDTEVSGEDVPGRPELDVQLLTENEYSRPGTPLERVNGIVIHYTANPGSSARSNRDYFENLKTTHTAKVSSHFIVGLEGEIVQCIPTAEISYASNDRNSDTIAIECCHPDETGQFNEATYDSMVHLTAWLCKKFDLNSEQVIRHYDVTGKDCPRYFVEHTDAWEQFKADVAAKKEEL